MKPLVSIILANLNGAAYLDDAIRSVLSQSFIDWELIAVDTGSTDGSQTILRDLASSDHRVLPTCLPNVLNYPAAINFGLRLAQGDYIARLESDDLWMPNKLQEQIKFLSQPENSGVGVVGSDALLLNSKQEIIGCKRFPRTHKACTSAIWYRNPLCHSTIICRREAIAQVGGYDESKYLVEDLDLWFRIAQSWQLANIPMVLVCYRVWEGSLTTRRMMRLARITRKLRRDASRKYGVRFSWQAWIAYYASYCAGFVPAKHIRRGFQWFVDTVGDLDQRMTT